jgi:GLPGLI family protein
MKLRVNNAFLAFSIISMIVVFQPSYAQHAYFVQSGKIEFEKRINMYAKLKSRISKDNIFMEKIYEEYRKTQPQFAISKSVLNFSSEKSIYQFLEEEKQRMSAFANEPWMMVKNSVYRNFKTDSVTAIRKVYDEDFVVTDRKPDILWKITNEVREIAGYQCKRANGLILDSIYVVAFYAEEIIPSGGPESFSGLPGMILGVALPHENVTWFATKVEIDKPLPASPMQLPRRAKQVSQKEYEESLRKSMRNWGQWGEDALKAFML